MKTQSKLLNTFRRAENRLCVIKYIPFCFSLSFLPLVMTFVAVHPDSCSNNMLPENLIKEPLISDSDPTTESQNPVALQCEGKLGNYILIWGRKFHLDTGRRS